jgi:beta-glucanase (GH16 family)
VDETTWDQATNHGFFVILSMAIGGYWRGNPTANTAAGGTMKVDYVRVYVWPTDHAFLPVTLRK